MKTTKSKKMDISKYTEFFDKTLRETGRRGIEAVIENLHKTDFYQAPASQKFHCSFPGGLLYHSVNVFSTAKQIAETKAFTNLKSAHITADSIAIAALLHDVCKANLYKTVEKFRKDKNNQWEKYAAFESDYSCDPFGHGEKSLIRLLRWGLELHDCEAAAIRWHMGSWDLSTYGDAKNCFNAACDATPLLPLIIAADGIASRVVENSYLH